MLGLLDLHGRRGEFQFDRAQVALLQGGWRRQRQRFQIDGGYETLAVGGERVRRQQGIAVQRRWRGDRRVGVGVHNPPILAEHRDPNHLGAQHRRGRLHHGLNQGRKLLGGAREQGIFEVGSQLGGQQGSLPVQGLLALRHVVPIRQHHQDQGHDQRRRNRHDQNLGANRETAVKLTQHERSRWVESRWTARRPRSG